MISGIQDCFPNYDIPLHMTIDHESLQKLFYIDPEDVENYIGFYSRAMTSPDNLLAVKAKEENSRMWFLVCSSVRKT